MADNDVLKMKVADLKRELKLRGLPTTGNKNELQERLQTALLDGDLTLEDTSIAEDLLDDGLTDEEEKGLDLSNEDAVLQSPDKEEDKSIASTVVGQQQQQKKVVLKRKTSISISSSNTTSPTSPAANTAISDSPPAEKITKIDSSEASGTETADGTKKVIKLSELSMKDRLEMRAKKFGTGLGTVSSTGLVTESAKLARAARFGQSGKEDSSASTTSTNGSAPTPATMDALKKRAERFGCSVSSRMVQLEREEKLMKRQQRFGASSKTTDPAAAGVSTNGANPVDYTEKAKQRLERFKTSVK